MRMWQCGSACPLACSLIRSFVRFVCVNALWISMDFSSEMTIASLSSFLHSVSIKWMHVDVSVCESMCAECERHMDQHAKGAYKNMFARYGFWYDFPSLFKRFSIRTSVALCRLMKSLVFFFLFSLLIIPKSIPLSLEEKEIGRYQRNASSCKPPTMGEGGTQPTSL